VYEALSYWQLVLVRGLDFDTIAHAALPLRPLLEARYSIYLLYNVNLLHEYKY
jgi:hypothetical protein